MRLPALSLCLILVMVLAGCGSASQPPIALTFPSGSAQAVDNGQSVTITVTGAGSQGVTWSLSGPGSLTNQTPTSVTYNAPAVGAVAKGMARGASATSPLISSADPTATVTATSVANSTRSATVTISITPPPAITTTTLPAGTEGAAYSQTIATSGGAGTLSLTVSTGSLPAGLGMDSSGHITGTPTGPNGTANFTVKVTDSSNGGAQSATQNLSILINLPAPPTISTTSLPAGVEGTAYNQTIAATGGLAPYTFSIVVPGTGALPAGLTISSAGVISGTPTGPNGTSNFTVKVTDSSNPNQSATQNLSITVNLPAPPSISTTSLPAGTEGAAYNQTVAATGGLTPYTFAVTGTLPAGLSIDTSGHITGTPTGPNGATSFTVTVTDSSNPPQTASKGLSITINLPAAPAISPTTLPNGNVGSPYSQTLTVSGGLGPFVWAVSSGTLPTGLALTTNSPTTTAKMSGTPTTVQSNVAFTISATDKSNPPQTGQQAYTVTINPPAPLSITTASLSNGAYNAAYSATISATGGIAPYTFSLDAASSPLPAGLAFTNDAANNQGVISGMPTTAGMFTNIIVDVHDSQAPTAATASKTYALTITAPAIVISPSSLPNGTVSTSYSVNVTASGGVSPYTFSLDATSSALPAGLSFASNSTTATISGTPTTAGTTNNIIIDLKDSEQPAVTQKMTYSITINAAAASCALSGKQLAFELVGDTSAGQAAMVGSVTIANDGSFTAGALDFRNQSTLSTNQAITGAAGSCTNGSVANTGSLTFAAGGTTRTLNFAMRADGTQGFVVESDSSGFNGTGQIQVQTAPSTPLDGSYAFGLEGGTPTSFFTVAGAACTDSSGAVTFLQADVGITGIAILTLTGASSNAGTLSAPDANGRVTTTSPFNYSNGTTVDSTFYNIDGSKAFQLNIGGSYPNGTGGTAPIPVQAGFVTGKPGVNCLPLGQGGSFTNSSVSNSVFSAQGIAATSTGALSAGGFVGVVYNFNATAGTATLTDDQLVSGAGAQGHTAKPVTYSVSTVGRLSLTATNNAGQTSTSFAYLDGIGNAYLIVGSKNGEGIAFGIVAPQTAVTPAVATYAFGSPIGPPSTVPLSLLPVTEVSITGTTIADQASGGSSGSYTCDTVGRCTAPSLSSNVTFGDTSIVFYVGGNTDSATSSAFIVLLQTTAANAQNSMLSH